MRLIYTTLSFLFLSVIYGQQTSSYVSLPVTPEAAALAKMINYPVNYNTGIPNINIPFYEIQVGNLKLPINLNYHSGGFKINEQATRVGLGWSLSCNIQITRTVQGEDDLTPTGYINNSLVTSSSPYQFYSDLTNFNYQNTFDLAMGEKDATPDKFNYSLLNKSGSFYFQKDSNGTGYSIIPVPFNNIKITYDEVNSTFTIIDTDGTTYYFGMGGVLDLELLDSRKKEVTNQTVTTWKCDRVESINKIDLITFKYVKNTPITQYSYEDKIEYYENQSPCQFLNYQNYYKSNEEPIKNITDYDDLISVVPFESISTPKYRVNLWNKSEFHVPYLGNQDQVNDKIFTKNSSSYSSYNTIVGIALSEITFRGGKANFIGADQLSAIKIIDEKGMEIKSINLFQNKEFYSDYQTTGTNYLDSLHIKNGNNVYEKYALLYNDKFDYGNHLKGNDVWGYLNHSTQRVDENTNSNIPEIKINQSPFYRDLYTNYYGTCSNYASNVEIRIGSSGDEWKESVNNDMITKGVLKGIIYPTGGIINFDFETNKYQELLSGYDYVKKIPQEGGGLRIRSINYFDENTKLIKQKYYRYGDLEEGTGMLMSHPLLNTEDLNYSFSIKQFVQDIVYLKKDPYDPYNNPNPKFNISNKETKTTYKPSSALNYNYPNGSSIYYTKVTEYEQDLGTQTGKKVFNYYNPTHFYDVNSPFIDRILVEGTNIHYIKTDWMSGALKNIETYKYDLNTGFKLTHKKSFEYNRYSLPNQLKIAYAFFKTQYIGSQYTSELYDPNNKASSSFISPSNEYIYGEYGLPMGCLLLDNEKEEWFEESGNRLSNIKYYYENLPYINPSRIEKANTQDDILETKYLYSYDFSGIYNQMKDLNMIDQLVEEVQTNLTKNIEISRKKTNYEMFDSGWGFFAPKSIQSSVKGSPLQTDITFNKYDLYANITEVIGKDGLPISYLWGYNSLYPVAELKNVYHSTIPATFTSNSQIGNPDNDSSLKNILIDLRNNFTNSIINTYSYKRLIGQTSFTDANRHSTYYNYDPIGRLISLKDNEESLIKTYNYNFKEFEFNSLFNSSNIPMMRTINYNCDTGRLENYVVSGGKYFHPMSNYANNSALDELDYVTNSQVYAFTGCDNTSITPAYFELSATFLNINSNYVNFPTIMEVDFIQNGSIVATQKFNINFNYRDSTIPTNFLLPEGEYQLSFRMNADVKYQLGFIPDYSITVDNNKSYINSGDRILFESGKHYKLDVVNWR